MSTLSTLRIFAAAALAFGAAPAIAGFNDKNPVTVTVTVKPTTLEEPPDVDATGTICDTVPSPEFATQSEPAASSTARSSCGRSSS